MKRWLPLLALTACTRASVIGYIDPVGPLDMDAAQADASAVDARVDAAVEDDAGLLVLDKCVPGVPVPQATVNALRGATADAGRWLYPYDETVMPRGVGAPALIWEGMEATAFQVTIQGRGLDYRRCAFIDAGQTVQLSAEDWALIEENSRGKQDPLTIQLAVFSAGKGYRLPPRTLTIASAPLGGSLFYMAASGILNPTPTGVVINQLPLGGTPRAILAPVSCAGCHAASANGTRLLATSNGLGALMAIDAKGVAQIGFPVTGQNTALSPDAKVYITPAYGRAASPVSNGASITQDATLYETDSAGALESGIVADVMMPSFAPEGDALVFTDFSLAAGKGVALMRYDAAARRFDGYRALFTSTRYPGWPSFLPGQRGIVFALGDLSDYSGGAYSPGTPAPSDLYAAELRAGVATPVLLHRAMGFATADDAAADRSELPFPEDDAHKSYNPRVAAVEAGGFHWVFFDSLRHYGAGEARRNIWCAAIDADDPTASHPAFFVRGQENDGSTFRPVWAQSP